MRLHIAGRVEDDQQRCVVCDRLLFDRGDTKVEAGMRVAESVGADDSDHQLEKLTPEESLPLGIYACKPPS
jgi:hypothetical protein